MKEAREEDEVVKVMLNALSHVLQSVRPPFTGTQESPSLRKALVSAEEAALVGQRYLLEKCQAEAEGDSR